MGSQNSTINPKGAAATIETEVFSVSVRSRLSRKFEEFKSRKNINKFEEKSLLYDDGAVNEDGIKEYITSPTHIKRLSNVVLLSSSADDDNNEKHNAQYIEEHRDFQDEEKLKDIEKNIKKKEKSGELLKENYTYDKINVKHEDIENNTYCDKTSILLDCRSPSFKIYCIKIDKKKEDDDNNNNNDEEEKEQEKFNDEEEETVKLLQQPAKTSIDDESVDESIESASSENSNALLVEMEPLTMATSKKKRLGKIKFGNMKNLNVKNIKNRIINPLLSSAQDRKLFTHSPK